MGYPEIAQEKEQSVGFPKEMYYNAQLVVDENGGVVANYRKSFLYYTDETWAEEGDVERGFAQLRFRPGTKGEDEGVDVVKSVNTTFGICMDINPYRFEAPWTAWEFANRILDSKSQLVIISMAWLTQLDREELDAQGTKPDLGTFNYWIQRFMPLFRRKMEHADSVDDGENGNGEKRVVVVFANRAGEEEGHGEDKSPVRYAGTSAVLAFSQKPLSSSSASAGDGDESEESRMDVKILCWDLMGAAEEGISFADTGSDPEMVFSLVKTGKN